MRHERPGRLGGRDRPRDPRPALDAQQDVLPLPERVRRRAQHAHLPGLHGAARRAAGRQPRGRRAHDRGRARARLGDRGAFDVPPQELLLSRLAQGVPDQPVRRTALQRRPAGRADGRRRRRRGLRARAPRGGRGQDRSTRAAAAGGWPARTAPSSTSTAAARRSWRWSREPDLRTPEQASRFASFLRETIVALGVSECDMEKGSLRVDANVSLRRPGEDELRTKTELKNMNSFSYLERGIARELRRQAELYEAGEEVSTQTLHYDPSLGRAHRAALQGARARLPLLPRARPRADRALRGAHRRACARRCPSCPRRACGASRASTRCRSPRRSTSASAAGWRRTSRRSRRPAAMRAAAANWVLNEFSAHLNEARAERGRVARAPGRAGGADRARRRRHARLVRRQAGLRGARRGRGRGRPGRDRRGARARPDRRRGRARRGRGRGRGGAIRSRPSSSARARRT